MKSNQRSTAEQVWQRVSPPAPGLSERETMLQLVRQLQCVRARFLRSSAKGTPLERLLYHQLAQTYLQEAACLKGVILLTAGAGVKEAANLSPTPTLGQCYRHALSRLNIYTLRSADPLSGPAFRQLEDQTRQHCMALLQLLGLNEKPPKGSQFRTHTGQ